MGSKLDMHRLRDLPEPDATPLAAPMVTLLIFGWS